MSCLGKKDTYAARRDHRWVGMWSLVFVALAYIAGAPVTPAVAASSTPLDSSQTSSAAVTSLSTQHRVASPADTGEYPYASEPCEHSPYASTGTGYWCANYDWGPKHTAAYNDPSEISPYGYAYRNCTDFVAWKLQSLGVPDAKTRGMGNANTWGTRAASKGVVNNSNPAVGSVAVDTSGNYGHVAIVLAVNGSIITVGEYNYHQDGNYDTRTGTASSLGFSSFDHYETFETGGGSGSVGDGQFLQVSGTPNIYRMVGGYPIYINDCAPLGGCPNVTVVSSLASFSSSIADGSYINVADGPNQGWVARAAGGSLMHMASCSNLSGCPGQILINQYSLDTYAASHPTVADGTYLNVADGSQQGWVVRAVGTALVHIGSCASLNGCPGQVGVDSYAYSTYAASHPTIADGTYLNVADGSQQGWVVRAVGTALVHIGSCASLNGCPGQVGVDSYAYSTYAASHPTIADGTYLNVADGSQQGWVVRAVGTALVHIGSCASLNGCPGQVGVDSYAYSTYAASHPTIADASTVEGSPSGAYLTFQGGCGNSGPGPNGPVQIDDGSLSGLAHCLAVMPPTIPAGALHRTYSQQLSASGGSGNYVWSVSSGSLPPGLTLASGGLINGKPNAAGVYSVTLAASDRNNSASTGSATYSISILAMAITTSKVKNAKVGLQYTQSFAASGGTKPLAWEITAGDLPPGLTLTSGGKLSGTPSSAGIYSFTITVIDSAARSNTDSRSFTMSVK